MFNEHQRNIYKGSGYGLNSIVQATQQSRKYFLQKRNSNENTVIYDNFTICFNFKLSGFNGTSGTNDVQWLFVFLQKYATTARVFARLLTAANLNIVYTTPEAINNSYNIPYTIGVNNSFGLSFEKNVQIKTYNNATDQTRVTRPYLASDIASDFLFMNNTGTGFKNDALKIWNFRLFHRVLNKQEVHAINAYNSKIIGSGFSQQIQDSLRFEYLLNQKNSPRVVDTGPFRDDARLMGYDTKDFLENGNAWK